MALSVKLKIYDDLLHKWQKKINLVGPQTLDDSVRRHFEDSLQLFPYLDGIITIADLGTGAGFPGLVLAIENTRFDVTLIESDQKKCSFLRTVSRETTVKVNILNERIEKLDINQKYDLVTARALADLNLLFSYAESFLIQNSAIKYIFLKGRNYQQELDDLKKNWSFDCEVKPSKIDPEGVILIFANIEKCE